MMDAFRRLDDEYRHRRVSFWLLVLSDFVRSAGRQHADALMETMDAPWPMALAVGGIAGSALFFGAFTGFNFALGRMPVVAGLLLRGVLVGAGLGWAQCVTVGGHFDRRKLWFLTNLAGGVALMPVTVVLSALVSSVRKTPGHAAFVVPVVVGTALLLCSLSLLMFYGRRNVVRYWLRMNVVALPLVVVFNAGLFIVLDILKFRKDEWAALFWFFWFVSNPVVLAVAIGAITARPLWRMAASRDAPNRAGEVSMPGV